MDKLEEIKESLIYGAEVEGKEYSHKALSQEDVFWLIETVERQQKEIKLYDSAIAEDDNTKNRLLEIIESYEKEYGEIKS